MVVVDAISGSGNRGVGGWKNFMN